MLHVTCLPKIWIQHMGEMTITYIFFRHFIAIFLRFLMPFLRLLLMVSALGQNDRYNRYISAFLERLLRVTAELIKMVQYQVWMWSVMSWAQNDRLIWNYAHRKWPDTGEWTPGTGNSKSEIFWLKWPLKYIKVKFPCHMHSHRVLEMTSSIGFTASDVIPCFLPHLIK